MFDLNGRSFFVNFSPDRSLDAGQLYELTQDSTGNFVGTFAVKVPVPVTGVVHESGQIEFDAQFSDRVQHFAVLWEVIVSVNSYGWRALTPYLASATSTER